MINQSNYRDHLSAMGLDLQNLPFDKIITQEITNQNLSLTILRLDKIHAEVSGNKLFKLCYFIEDCLQTAHRTLLTFGGAFSNHLVATAFLCKQKGIKSIGIVRGGEPPQLSHTLIKCKEFGMELKFVSREEYADFTSVENDFAKFKSLYGDFAIVPEGGYNATGAKGASLIMDILKQGNYSHICTAVGTATTLAGLLLKKESEQEIIAVPVIKNMHDIPFRLNFLGVNAGNQPVIFGDFHFGGYAKHADKLIQFMNKLYAETNVPTDFVYTAKMMYGVYEKINSSYFSEGSNIICIHTGGLQGNLSLPAGTLIF